MYKLLKIDKDLKAFLQEQSKFTRFGEIVFEHKRANKDAFIISPEYFQFENQSFESGLLFSRRESLSALHNYIIKNQDVTLLVSDDFELSRNAPFLLEVEEHFQYFGNQIVWSAETPMDENKLSYVLNAGPVHSLTLGIINHKIKSHKHELNELEVLDYVNNTKFLIYSIFDGESFLVIELC